MPAKKPIIIFGTGRSGTSLFHKMFSEHSHLAWLSGLSDRYPDKPVLNKYLMKSLECRSLERVLRKRLSAKECYQFWNYYSTGFSTPCRDLLASDVSEKTKQNMAWAMSKLTTEKRHRLLLKITGWPRIGFLSEIFPDAKFIHVIRDGRAVANSLINVDFWRGWEGPDKWRWGSLSKTHQQEWNNNNQSFIVLAAIQWKILMDSAEAAKKHIEKSRLLELKYEDLCSNPVPLFMEVAGFAEIEWSDDFAARLKKYTLRNTNHKYKQELNRQQIRELDRVLGQYLEKYGYL